MPVSSLLALIDDIATTLDDVAVMTKVAAKKTSGVLGDDLALNAEQVSGVHADRELPVVFAVAKGSAVNKLILVPSFLLVSAFAPGIVTPLLIFGGLFLCFEGFEKVYEKLFHHSEKKAEVLSAPESEKIKGAIRTDFILSAEIIVITLGTVASAPLVKQIGVLGFVSAIMTIGVYGLVAVIVKLDDLGFYLIKPTQKALNKTIGKMLLLGAPLLMKSLGVLGTIAMFLVGGGILTHGIPFLHHIQEKLTSMIALGFDLGVGICAGAIVLLVVSVVKRILKR